MGVYDADYRIIVFLIFLLIVELMYECDGWARWLNIYTWPYPKAMGIIAS